jgi:hypothetical protein
LNDEEYHLYTVFFGNPVLCTRSGKGVDQQGGSVYQSEGKQQYPKNVPTGCIGSKGRF